MINWIKKTIGKHLNNEYDKFGSAALGVNEMERSLLMVVARHYPHSYRDLLTAYVNYGRSIDKIIRACEDARQCQMDLWTALRLGISY